MLIYECNPKMSCFETKNELEIVMLPIWIIKGIDLL